MRDRWTRLDDHTKVILGVAFGFVLFRATIASLSGFGFHQGWNEGHYALIASGFLDHPLVPRYADRFVYSVPPLFPYSVAASFLLFGESVLAARLPSILAGGALIVVTYGLGLLTVNDRRTALIGGFLIATLPYVQLYSGRVQTDVLMVCLATGSLAAIVRGYQTDRGHRRWLIVGGALFAAAFATKQPAIIVPAIVLAWLVGNRRFDRETVRRTTLLIGASGLFLLPLAIWLYLNYTLAPAAFVTDWEHELFGRTRAFANVPLLVLVGFGLGVTPVVLVSAAIGVGADLTDTVRNVSEGARSNIGPSVLTWWLIIYGAFVFARTPHGHQYYAIALTPPFTLFAAKGLRIVSSRTEQISAYREEVIHITLIVVVLTSTVAGTVILFELSGELSPANGGGSNVAADAGDFVGNEVPDNATVLVENGYEPPLMWYVRNDFPPESVTAYHTDQLDDDRLQTAISESNGPVYLVYPDPSWGTMPSEQLTQVHETESYQFTVMAVVGSYAQTDSKFTYYLNDRRLVIYRVESSSSISSNE